jgi:hypothetical protein
VVPEIRKWRLFGIASPSLVGCVLLPLLRAVCSLGARGVTFGRNGQIIDQPVKAPSDHLVFPAGLSPSPSPTVRKSWRAPLRLRVCHQFDGQAREENERLREEFKRRITIALRCDRQYGGDVVLDVARLRSDQQVQGSNSRHA